MRCFGHGTRSPSAPPPEEHYPADKARRAEIELRRPWQRYVFIGGLVAIVVLLLILRLAAATG
jgi:hypothetical protein